MHLEPMKEIATGKLEIKNKRVKSMIIHVVMEQEDDSAAIITHSYKVLDVEDG